MDTPPMIEPAFEEESIVERIVGLSEMFPESIRDAVSQTVSKSTFCLKLLFSSGRKATWFLCSTAAILALPISLERERLDYEAQMKRQERNILLGPETG